MSTTYQNPLITSRFEELIAVGEELCKEQTKSGGVFSKEAQTRLLRWTTSSLNLLDKLSVSTNRYVREFDRCIDMSRLVVVVCGAVGVLHAALDDYKSGLAIDYHLSVSSTIFGGLLDEARYLQVKGYLRAAAVLAGAALEEGLKSRARAISIEVTAKDTLNSVIQKLKSPDAGVITEFEAKQMEAIAKLRNDAAHGGEFNYQAHHVEQMIDEVGKFLAKMLSGK